MRYSILTYSNVNVMNSYVDNVCISEDESDNPKENAPPTLPFPYSSIYPVIFCGLISYVNTYHFIILFFYVVHAWQYLKKNLPVSKLKPYLYSTSHFNSSATTLMQWTGLVPYKTASIGLVKIGSLYGTSGFTDPLFSICNVFNFNSSFVTHVRMTLIPLLITLRVSIFLVIVHCFENQSELLMIYIMHWCCFPSTVSNGPSLYHDVVTYFQFNMFLVQDNCT